MSTTGEIRVSWMRFQCLELEVETAKAKLHLLETELDLARREYLLLRENWDHVESVDEVNPEHHYVMD